MNTENDNKVEPANNEQTPNESAETNLTESDLKIEQLQKDNEELKDKYIRAIAETENVKTRYSKEAEERSTYAISNFAREILALSDNLKRIVSSFPEDTKQNPVLEGIIMTEKQLQSILAKFNIKEVEAIGLKFNPELHEALFELKDSTKADEEIVQVVEAGYLIGNRLLRPAKVGINKQ